MQVTPFLREQVKYYPTHCFTQSLKAWLFYKAVNYVFYQVIKGLDQFMMNKCPTYSIERFVRYCSVPVGFQETAVEKEPFPSTYCKRKSNKLFSLLQGSVSSQGVRFSDVCYFLCE